jgi:hypothetical protein
MPAVEERQQGQDTKRAIGRPVPPGLLTEIKTALQLQERLVAIGRTYNVNDQMSTAFGNTITLGNGKTLIWYGRIWLFNGNITIADVTGVTLELAMNRAIEDAVHYFAMQPADRGRGKVA